MNIAKDIEELEINLLLEAIFQRFGNDFRNHQKHNIRRKLHGFMKAHLVASIYRYCKARFFMTWAQYNLGTDASFNEFEIIVCCNGLTDLTWRSRHRVLQIFYESQPNFGMLAITGEAPLEITSLVSRYKALSTKYGLCQRVV